MLRSFESIHNGFAEGVLPVGKRYVRMLTLGICKSGNGDVKGIMGIFSSP